MTTQELFLNPPECELVAETYDIVTKEMEEVVWDLQEASARLHGVIVRLRLGQGPRSYSKAQVIEILERIAG